MFLPVRQGAQNRHLGVPWDLAVLDEAHRLRNIFKGTNKTAAAIAEALEPRHKLLLTATPLKPF
jgi:hypothetical protein